jgi:D-alanyl-D-alanine carboxypeptidase
MAAGWRRLRATVIGPPWAAVVIALALVLFTNGTATAQVGSERYSSFVMEAANGRVLWAVNPDEPRHPASLTKMMTLYMAFEALRDRRIALSQPVPVSDHAAAMLPSKLDLVPGTQITVEQAILGLVTKSANDAAAALGELLGGDEERFAQMMTLRARALGMTQTVFRNASGWPDPEQVTTARDLAVLARHLIQDFPAEYRYFSIPSFVFHGRTILNHDHLLDSYPGADGLKTGYTEASGFNLVTSAVRGGVRLIGVVMGAAHPGERDLHMAALLDRGFEQLDVPLAPRVANVASRIEPLLSAAQAASPRIQATESSRAQPSPRWGITVGSFATERAARAAADNARRIVDAGAIRVVSVALRGRHIWRAELGGLSQTEARNSCAVLVRHRIACAPLHAEAGQVASR